MKDIEVLGSITKSPMLTYINAAPLCTKVLGVELLPDITKPEFCLHSVFKLAKPKPVLGVDYGDLEFLRPITMKEFGDVQQSIVQLYSSNSESFPSIPTASSAEVEECLSFFYPAFIPQRAVSALQTTTEQVIALSGNDCLFKTSMKLEPMISGTDPEIKRENPTAFLPSDSMFDDKLTDLTIHDILTIFPNTEAELLAICIGRGLVGPDGTTTAIGGHKISHSYRTFPLIFGGPGLGKSTLFDFLFSAIRPNGYKISNFNDFDQQFGMGEIVNSNFSYCDDLINNSLRNLLQAPLFKQCITGSKIRAHIKFQNDIEVQSTTTFIANINNFDASILNSIDAGTLNRLAIISTLSSREISKKKGSGLTANSPNLRTRENIEWLADTLGVSIDAIMLKFARLCAEKFYSLAASGELESKINMLKRGLRVQLHEQINASFIQLLHFAYLLTSSTSSIPQINGLSLQASLEALDALLNDAKFNPVRNLIKEDWDKQGRPSDHIFSALKLIDSVSVGYASRLDVALPILKDPVKSIKVFYESLRLDSGFNIPCNIGQIKLDWSASRSNAISDLMDLLSQVDDIQQYRGTANRDTAHVFEVGYDREAIKQSLNS